MLTDQRNDGCEHCNSEGDFLGGFVVLAPFWSDVIGDGGCARQHLTVSCGHGCCKDRCEDEAAKERAQFTHGEFRQASLSPISAQFRQQHTASKANEEHEDDERRLPNEEPGHGFFSRFVVLQRHHTGNHLRLASDAEAAKEERSNPKGRPKHQARRKHIDHRRTDVSQLIMHA